MNGAKVPKIRTNSAFLWTLNPLNQFETPYEPPCCNRVIVSRVSLDFLCLDKGGSFVLVRYVALRRRRRAGI